MCQYLQQFMLAYKGKRIWKSIRLGWGKEDDVLVLMFPEDNGDLTREIFIQLDDYMKRKSYDQAVIILSAESLAAIKQPLSKNINTVELNNYELEALSAYYRLHWFYDSFIYASISMPYGNTVSNMLKSKKMTLGELVSSSIFG